MFRYARMHTHGPHEFRLSWVVLKMRHISEQLETPYVGAGGPGERKQVPGPLVSRPRLSANPLISCPSPAVESRVRPCADAVGAGEWMSS